MLPKDWYSPGSFCSPPFTPLINKSSLDMYWLWFIHPHTYSLWKLNLFVYKYWNFYWLQIANCTVYKHMAFLFIQNVGWQNLETGSSIKQFYFFFFFLRLKDERMWKNLHYKKIQMSAAQLVILWTKIINEVSSSCIIINILAADTGQISPSLKRRLN